MQLHNKPIGVFYLFVGKISLTLFMRDVIRTATDYVYPDGLLISSRNRKGLGTLFCVDSVHSNKTTCATGRLSISQERFFSTSRL